MNFLCAYILIGLIALSYGLNSNENEEEREWKEFKIKFNKHYNATEDVRRFDIFKSTFHQNKEQNEKFASGLSTWEAGLNEFSDWTVDEKKNLNGALPPPPSA